MHETSGIGKSRDREEISCQEEGDGEWPLMGTGFPPGVMKKFRNEVGMVVAQLVNILNATKYFTSMVVFLLREFHFHIEKKRESRGPSSEGG